MGTVPMISVSRKDCPKSTLPTWRTDFARDFTSQISHKKGKYPTRKTRDGIAMSLAGDCSYVLSVILGTTLAFQGTVFPQHYFVIPGTVPIISGTGPVILFQHGLHRQPDSFPRRQRVVEAFLVAPDGTPADPLSAVQRFGENPLKFPD